MRIVAGRFRRRKLRTNRGLVTRPITDRAKETLFEHLGGELDGERVADVFAGTGTIGLEALSRGASTVVFVEQDRKAHALLQENADAIGVTDDVLCWRADVLRCSFRPKGVPRMVPFDLVFFDPPYKMIAGLQEGSPLFKSLERLAREDVTSPNATLVLRTPRDAEFEIPPAWHRERGVPISAMEFHFYTKQPTPADDSPPDDEETPA